MKQRAVVIAVDDPKSLNRIRVKLLGYEDNFNETPWVWPCVSLAGAGYGAVILPVIDDEVWVEKSEDGDWVYVGSYWSERGAPPSEGSATVRVFKTPAGHLVRLDESGDIAIEHTAGPSVVLTKDGEVKVFAEKTISLESNGEILLVGTDKVHLKSDSEVHLDCPLVNLGQEAAEAVLLGESFQGTFNDFVSEFNSHNHVYIDSVGMAATPTPKTSNPPGAPATSSGSKDLSKIVKTE